MAAIRPTPVDPIPDLPDVVRRAGDHRAMPPELGPNAIAVSSGPTFMYSDSVGDVPAGSIAGLVHLDTRLLSRWELTVNGGRMLVLRSGSVDHYSAQFFLTNGQLAGLPPDTLGLRRLRYVGDGFHERIELLSYGAGTVQIELRLAVGADFADLFEIKSVVSVRSASIVRRHAPDGSELSFRYEQDGYVAQTRLSADPPADRVEGDELVWLVDLNPREEWKIDLHVPLSAGLGVVEPVRGDIADVFHHRVIHPVSQWIAESATLTSGNPMLEKIMQQSRVDLAALRLDHEVDGQRIALPAAGLPWFLTMFGRDTIITAYQTLISGPRMAKGALLALARLQGTRQEDRNDEEPGRIPHEIRSGELTRRGLKPYKPYYGNSDATPLWLILLSEYWRWTGDDELVRSLRDNALAALTWIDRYGDRDGDGYVEYATRSPEGLGNQCWRDSPNGVQFADGRIPVLPIATCEIQGYVYDAKVRLAELAEGPLADRVLAARLRADAQQLYDRFNRDFWIEDRGGYYAVGLDGDKDRIDSKTSNMGHLLWSGIVPPERAEHVARQLLSPAMFSGWGIRTLSEEDAGYNALGYHLGTVWPHDNSIAVLGLVRYGFRSEANRIALALLDAAAACGNRLPEAMSGYYRERTLFPVPYPTACSPQAWAAGAPLNLVRAMVGLNPVDGRLVIDPDIPPEIGSITARQVCAFGSHWSIDATGRTGRIDQVAA